MTVRYVAVSYTHLDVYKRQAFGKRFNIDVRTRSEVIAIHSADKTVDIRTSDGKTYRCV